MSTQFICSQCRTILDESERRLHISAQHLEYFPYECSFCQKTNLKFLATTEADMDEHISTYHNGNNAVTLHNKKKDKEAELNKMVEQCIRLSIPHTPSIDSKIELRRALNLLDNAGTSAGYEYAAPNGPALIEVKLESDNDDDVTIIDHDSEIAALSKNTSGGNLSEHPTQEHAECLAVIEHKEPNEDSTTNLVIENYDVPNTVLPKEPSVNISTAPIETNEPTDQAVARPITENTPSYENTYAILPKTEPSVNISIVPEPENFTESYPEFHVPRESTSDRKRELLDGISDNDSLESTKKRKVVMNEEQLGSGGHCSLDVNRSNANGPSRYVNPSLMNAIFSRRNDSVEHPTTSFQVTSSVPDDSSQKQIITKLFIVISEGIVYYETNDRRVHEYESLSDCVETLAGSELCRYECEVVIQFYADDTGIPLNYRYSERKRRGKKYKQEFSSLEQLKAFARQLHSIAFLWADITVNANFGPFKKKSNKSPSQFDYCSELFSRERSILKCKKLGVTLVDNWSLSIVTNVVDRCDECELLLEEVSSGNYQLHEAFLQEIYERKLIQKIAVTLSIPELENVNDFIEKLKERFRRAPQKCFKFELLAHSMEIRKFSLKFRDCILKAKESKNYLKTVIVEQCAIGS